MARSENGRLLATLAHELHLLDGEEASLDAEDGAAMGIIEIEQRQVQERGERRNAITVARRDILRRMGGMLAKEIDGGASGNGVTPPGRGGTGE